MYIPRLIEQNVLQYLTHRHKVIIILGPRQVGKTTLSQKIVDYSGLRVTRINADYPEYHRLFRHLDFSELQALVTKTEILFIDEGHQLPNIGKALKILHDEYPNLKIIVTGSASFDLSSKITEPLTGRKAEFLLTPFLLREIENFYDFDPVQLKSVVRQAMIYGLYPEVFLEKGEEEKKQILMEIANSYLFKDILSLASVKHPQKLIDLTMFLAFHIGQPISINELSDSLSINHDTVERYLDLLQKIYVIFRVPVFSTRFRNVLKKKSKYYFYDTGIRNAVIKRFSPLNQREDIGNLWENFVIAERFKLALAQRKTTQFFYWRTYDGAEIDLIEQTDNTINAFEIKVKKIRQKPPQSWSQVIKKYTFETVTMDNFGKFLL